MSYISDPREGGERCSVLKGGQGWLCARDMKGTATRGVLFQARRGSSMQIWGVQDLPSMLGSGQGGSSGSGRLI